MTKKDAAEKVAKLRRLAQGTKNPHEADAARKQADKIAAEHGLTSGDLVGGKMAAAFDDLVGEVEKVVDRNGPMTQGLFGSTSVIKDVLAKIRDLEEHDKSKKLRQITTAVRVASFIAGDNKLVANLKVVLDSTLKNHDVTI